MAVPPPLATKKPEEREAQRYHSGTARTRSFPTIPTTLNEKFGYSAKIFFLGGGGVLKRIARQSEQRQKEAAPNAAHPLPSAHRPGLRLRHGGGRSAVAMVTGRREAGRRGREGSGGRRRAGRAATEQHREGGRSLVGGCSAPSQSGVKASQHSKQRRFPLSSPALTHSAALQGSVPINTGSSGAPPRALPPSPGAVPRAESRARAAAQHGGAAGLPQSRPCPAEPPSAPPPPGGCTELEAW